MIRSMLIAGALVSLAGAASAAADDDYRFARVRSVEPSVAVQRASESEADELVVNAPFVAGDRVWSDGRGRAEFELFDGSLLWLNARSKVDYSGNEQTGGREQVLLRLWSGALLARQRPDGAARLDIETSAATVHVEPGAVVRVDASPSATRVSVREGAAQVESDNGNVRLEIGERTDVRPGAPPDRPWRTSDTDDFDAWASDRDANASVAAGTDGHLPEQLEPYAQELDRYGNWYFEGDAGYVWRPRVDVGWSPYSNGRWTWTLIGWTWIPYESWGWAPSHYGRWGLSARLGWYWIPDRVFGPAWVSWAVGGSHIGWCALDRWNRPIRQGQGPRDGHDGWTFVRRGDFSSHDLHGRRAGDVVLDSTRFRVFASNSRRPVRSFDGVLDAHQPPPRPVLLRRPESQHERPNALAIQRTGAPAATRQGFSAGGTQPSEGRAIVPPRSDAGRARVTTRVGGVPNWVQRPRQEAPGASAARPQSEAAPRPRAIERRQPERDASQEQHRAPDRGVMGGIFGRLGGAQHEDARPPHEPSGQSRGSSNPSHAAGQSGHERHPSQRHD